MGATICVCGGIKKHGECSRCGPIVKTENRENSNKRGYDYQWSKLSKAVREQEPLCHDCLEAGRTKPSEEVHHIKKVADYPELRMVRSNLMALCESCHSIRTARGE